MRSTHILVTALLTAGLVLGGRVEPVAGQATDTRPSVKEENPRDILTPQQWKSVDATVDRALAWLATQQRANGSFPTLEAGQPAVTSLCVLACLARGHLPGEGRYGSGLNRAITYVLDCQQSDGVFSRIPPTASSDPLSASHNSNYNHPIAGLMLCEVYGMTRGDLNQRIRPAIEKALKYASRRLPQPKRRAVDEGGWRYLLCGPSDCSDLSITSWHLMFLRSCKNAGFDVPDHLIDEALQYVGRLYQSAPGTFVYALNDRVITRAMAGAGILSFSLGGRHGDERARQAGEFILQHPFTRYNQPEFYNERFFYSAFYSSLAMFQLGGRHWKECYPTLARTLIGHQRTDGSWDRDSHVFEQHYGENYTTALAVLALSPPYQLLPIFQR